MSDPKSKEEHSKYKDFRQAPARDRVVDYHKKRKKKKVYTHAVVTEYDLSWVKKLGKFGGVFRKPFKSKYTSLELAERNLAKKQREQTALSKHVRHYIEKIESE